MNTPKTLNVTEQHQLLNSLLVKTGTQNTFRKAFRNYTMACCMLEAGLRVGELVALVQTDLLFNSEPVTSIIIRSEIAKNHTERTIPVSTRLSKALNQMTEYFWPWRSDMNTLYAFYQKSPHVPLTTRQVERIIRKAAMQSIGRPVHPHVLRHTFASRLMRVTSMRTVQELLGHTNIQTTQIYTHPNSDDLKKAIKQVESGAAAPDHRVAESPPGADLPNSFNAVNTDGDMG